MPAKRAIVFDLDGTLVDSLPDIAGHLNAALVDHGYRALALDEIRPLVGTGAERLVGEAIEALGGGGGRERIAAVLASFRAHYRASPHGRTQLFGGLAAVLDELRARPRCALGVLSNKPHDLVVAIASHVLARWQFDAVVGERSGRAKKPDPGELLAMVDELGATQATTVLVGDSEIDIATARAANIRSIAVSWGLRERAALVASGPHAIVDTPAQLARAIDTLTE